jgi:hypothetical protein
MNQGGRFETDATSFSPVHSENGLTVKRELIFSSIGQNEIVDKMVGLSVIMSRPHKWVKHRIEFSILKKHKKQKCSPFFWKNPREAWRLPRPWKTKTIFSLNSLYNLPIRIIFK